MTTAATSMTTMRPGALDELQHGELLTMFLRAPRSSPTRDAACEVLGTSQSTFPGSHLVEPVHA